MFKSLRLKHYNYKTDGYYFITIITHNKLHCLRHIKDKINDSISNLPKYIIGLNIDYFVIMDNHIHIIFILENCNRDLGGIVRALKYSITKIYKQQGFTNQHISIWQNNYYEHVIRNEKALFAIRKYIQENPEKKGINCKQFISTT